MVDDDRAYEAIIAIGYQTNQIVDKEITRVNSDYRIEFVFPPIKDPPKCDGGEKLIDDECQPVCDEDEELIDGKCVPIPPICEQVDTDGTKCPPPPYECPQWEPVPCDPIEPDPEPICGGGEELVDGQCSPIANPVEPIDPMPIDDEDENGDDESNLSEGDSNESEDEDTNEDESDESENESENEDSGEEVKASLRRRVEVATEQVSSDLLSSVELLK